MNIAEPDVFAFDAKLEQHVQTSDPSGPATCRHDLNVLELFAGNVQCIGRSGSNDNGGPVLIVMKNGDVHPFAAQLFDDKAIGCFDVFQVYGAECWL